MTAKLSDDQAYSKSDINMAYFGICVSMFALLFYVAGQRIIGIQLLHFTIITPVIILIFVAILFRLLYSRYRPVLWLLLCSCMVITYLGFFIESVSPELLDLMYSFVLRIIAPVMVLGGLFATATTLYAQKMDRRNWITGQLYPTSTIALLFSLMCSVLTVLYFSPVCGFPLTASGNDHIYYLIPQREFRGSNDLVLYECDKFGLNCIERQSSSSGPYCLLEFYAQVDEESKRFVVKHVDDGKIIYSYELQ